ncbi:MAG: hypothetical protein WCA77_07075 [Thermoplasmata archaeon]
MSDHVIPRRIALCEFDRLSDKVPKPREWTWPELVVKLTHHDVREEKDGGLWSPALYRLGATRGNDGVLEITAGVEDIDDGWSIPDAVALLERQGLEFILHTSHSHTSNLPKYRVVVPFEQPVPSMVWGIAWPRIAALFEGHIDRGTKDPARIYFWPSHPLGEPSEVRVGRGRPLDVWSLPAPLLPRTDVGPRRDFTTATVPSWNSSPQGFDEVLARLRSIPLGAEAAELVRALANGEATTDGWTGHLADWLTDSLVDIGLSDEEIERFHVHAERVRHTSTWADRARRVRGSGKRHRLRRETLREDQAFAEAEKRIEPVLRAPNRWVPVSRDLVTLAGRKRRARS